MPYIPKEGREKYKDWLKAMPKPESSGEMNYIVTRIVAAFINHMGGVSYNSLMVADGTLDMVKQELYRRISAPYEDRKREEYGDVFKA